MPVILRWILSQGITNPITVRLVQNGSRRTRHLLIRAGYLGVLIAVLLYALLLNARGDELSYQQLAKAGSLSFKYIAYLQIGLICVLAPVFMAGAIAQEADPKTWDILLTTPLSSTQIVLGNLLGRLLFILALLFSSLPLFAVTQYFGGVPGSSIFGSYLIAACAALLVGATAIALSVSRLVGKRAVFTFYTGVVSYLALTYAIDKVRFGGASVSWMTAINPFLALQALLDSSGYPRARAGTQTGLAAWFLERPVTTWCVLSSGLAVVQVLEGRDNEVNAQLAARMEEAAARLDFEAAARLRDQLAALKAIQAQQVVAAEGERDADVFAIAGEPGNYAVSVMLVRGGRSLGTSGFFPRGALAEPAEALASFMMQYYAEREAPPEIFADTSAEDAATLADALSQLAGRAVRVKRAQRGMAARWVELVRENATQSLRMRLARKDAYDEMAAALADDLGLEAPPSRMECFDISHTQGEGTVASCVVFGPEGPLKKEYRRFNITGVTPGDDYGALRQAVQRRYTRIGEGEVPRPDLLLIDGGAAQLASVRAVLLELGFDDLPVVGVSKGADRKPGQERLHRPGDVAPLIPGPESVSLRLVQRIRDEAHRFAIAGHRRRRAKRFNESILETVPGLGPAKRRALLRHFGGLQGIMRAGVADLERAEGIGATLARSLYDHLHPGE